MHKLRLVGLKATISIIRWLNWV